MIPCVRHGVFFKHDLIDSHSILLGKCFHYHSFIAREGAGLTPGLMYNQQLSCHTQATWSQSLQARCSALAHQRQRELYPKGLGGPVLFRDLFFPAFFFFFWLCLQHMEVPRPGIEPTPQQWKYWILNSLCRQGNPPSGIFNSTGPRAEQRLRRRRPEQRYGWDLESARHAYKLVSLFYTLTFTLTFSGFSVRAHLCRQKELLQLILITCKFPTCDSSNSLKCTYNPQINTWGFFQVLADMRMYRLVKTLSAPHPVPKFLAEVEQRFSVLII